jgi:hypothetical protein
LVFFFHSDRSFKIYTWYEPLSIWFSFVMIINFVLWHTVYLGVWSSNLPLHMCNVESAAILFVIISYRIENVFFFGITELRMLLNSFIVCLSVTGCCFDWKYLKIFSTLCS